jgi:hypothetical protein
MIKKTENTKAYWKSKVNGKEMILVAKNVNRYRT